VKIFIGLDDTDNLESRGTGHLARTIADVLAVEYESLGVTRHQLSTDPRIPCTKKNSCAAILLEASQSVDLQVFFEKVAALVLADFQPGSDPGLCLTADVPIEVTHFGRRAQSELVTQQDARFLADQHGILLRGLGGTYDGVIGALAAVGLAACGEDGRYVQIGRIRQLGEQATVDEVLAAGVSAVQTTEGEAVYSGKVLTEKLRPARRGGRPVAVVEASDPDWLPLILD
jgi:tRNA(Ile2) C34 agmatinyltransferase TiaS